jgi:scyllo-inositol 2-dehydrogenase (NADP+)
VKHAFDVQEPKLRVGRFPWNEIPSEAEQRENSGVHTLVNADGTTKEQLVPPASTDYRNFYANVRDVLLGTAAAAVTPQQALNVMRVLELARESSTRRCTIPWPA